jgi:DNA-binding NarL/FixJ family response regulator
MAVTADNQRLRAARCRLLAHWLPTGHVRSELLLLAAEIEEEAAAIAEAEARAAEAAAAARARLGALTPRQFEVLRHVSEGLRNKQIAFALGIDEKTVKMHRAAALARMRATCSIEAVRLVVEARLGEPAEAATFR